MVCSWQQRRAVRCADVPEVEQVVGLSRAPGSGRGGPGSRVDAGPGLCATAMPGRTFVCPQVTLPVCVLVTLLIALVSQGCAHQNLQDDIIPGVEYLEETPENHRSAARRLLVKLGVESMLSRALEAQLRAQIELNPELRRFEGVTRDFLNAHINWETLREDYINLYVFYYSQSELEELYAFYDLPVGKKVIALQPALIEKGFELGRRRVQDNIEAFQKQLQEEMSSDSKPAR